MPQFPLSPNLRILLAFLLAALVTGLIVPSLVAMAKKRGLVAHPGERTVHSGSIPNLGGVALFSAIMLSAWIFWDVEMIGGFQFKVVSVFIVFVLGLMDDIMNISPAKKFGGEIIASIVLIVIGGVRLTNFHGYLGIGDIPYWASLAVSIFVFLLIINAFNLIDGIDGLAAGIGIVTTATYGIWFWLAGFVAHSILAGAVLGALFVFFYFNVFSKRYKIFMGDTGALVIGVIVAIFTIQFNQQTIDQTKAFAIYAAPAVSMGILIIPLFDTLRVFTLRMLKGRSPFYGDKTHIHHMLLDLGLSHFQATMVLVGVNILFVVLAFWLQSFKLNTLIFLGILFVFILLLTLIPILILKKKKSIVNKN